MCIEFQQNLMAETYSIGKFRAKLWEGGECKYNSIVLEEQDERGRTSLISAFECQMKPMIFEMGYC